jgi:hypothetical protein
MRAVRPPFAKASLSCLAAACFLAGCARPLDMSVVSLHQKLPEFDFLVYRDGWACLSDGAPGREAAGPCAANGGRQLRELFSQRSSSRSLREYLTENGASCRVNNTVTTCSYTKPLAEAPLVFGRQAAPSREEGFELTVTFPARDQNLAPDQITTAMRRFTRVL